MGHLDAKGLISIMGLTLFIFNYLNEINKPDINNVIQKKSMGATVQT